MRRNILIIEIPEFDESVAGLAKQRQYQLAKPYGSLGRLETISCKVAGITQSFCPPLLRRAIVVFAADNGVFAEGITPIGQEITALQSLNMLQGRAGVGVLAKQAQSKLMVVDVGMIADMNHPELICKKIRHGTCNIAQGAAMSREECMEAIQIGLDIAKQCSDEGIAMIGVGEMGVGNTTTSSAVASVLLQKDPAAVTGQGAGLNKGQYKNKLDVIRRAVEVNAPDAEDPLDVLQKVGGFDLAAMVGCILGAASHRMVVVIDGFISICTALVAQRINSRVTSYLILSHRSAELGYDLIANELEMTPLLDLQMRLGEGSGCALAFSIIDDAMAILNNMATFEEAKIASKDVADNWDQPTPE